NGYCNDPDGDSISYSPASGGDQATVAWSISGSELTLDVADDFNTVGGNTIYIELIADDGNGGVTLQTLSVDVSPVNDPPVITTTTLGGFDNLVAGSIKEYDAEIEFSDVDWGREGDSHTAAVQLDGEDAVQGDGKGIGTVTCTSGNPGTIGFGWTIPSEMVGSHKIAVTVTDYQGASDTKEYDVEVRAIQPPRAVATATPDKTLANPGQTADITLDGSQSTDPDGNIVSYLWQEGITTVGAGVTPTVPFAIGTHAVTLTVTDDDGASATDDVVITVNENQPPIADAGENQVAGEGETVVLDGNESYDPDGSVVSYSWTVLSARITLKDADTATPSFVAPQVDLETNYEIMLIVGDDIGAISAADTIIVTVQDLSDVTTPRVNISLPAPDGENGYYITAPTLSIEVDDESSGIEWIRVEVNGNLHEFFPDPPAPLSWVESYIVSEDGTYDIKVKSQDLAGNESLEIVLDTIYLDTTPPAITYNTVVVNGVEQQILGETVSIGAVIRDIEVRCSATDSFSGIGTNDVHLSIGGASLVVSALDTSQVIDEGNQEGNPSLPALPPGNNNLPEEENGGVEEGAAEEEGKKGDSLDEVGDEESSREDQGRGDGGGADTFMAGAFGVGVLDVGTEVYSTLDYSATSTYSFDVGENTVSSGVSDRAGNYSEGSVVFSVEGVIENSYCYPVPLNSLSQVLKVAFSLEAANSIRVDIYNERAALIRTQTVLGELGNNVVTFSERLDNGLYLYQIVNLSKDSTLIGRGKFVVVNK
ncbi:MAG: PKD domain-containing protein, partial [Candidatus Saganbacteria bacterium]|nr:PKD domain-containing protein [Candidatus Saganbacteria bacterium]